MYVVIYYGLVLWAVCFPMFITEIALCWWTFMFISICTIHLSFHTVAVKLLLTLVFTSPCFYFIFCSQHPLSAWSNKMQKCCSGVEKRDCLTLEEETGCTKTLVWNYHSTLRTIPEEHGSHLHCGISLKSCKSYISYLLKYMLILNVCFLQ
jgi:hypothetical protein